MVLRSPKVKEEMNRSDADGTYPAKVAHRPSQPTKVAKPGLFPEDKLSTKLLKWGLPERGSNLLKSRRPLTSTTPR